MEKNNSNYNVDYSIDSNPPLSPTSSARSYSVRLESVPYISRKSRDERRKKIEELKFPAHYSSESGESSSLEGKVYTEESSPSIPKQVLDNEELKASILDESLQIQLERLKPRERALIVTFIMYRNLKNPLLPAGQFWLTSYGAEVSAFAETSINFALG